MSMTQFGTAFKQTGLYTRNKFVDYGHWQGKRLSHTQQQSLLQLNNLSILKAPRCTATMSVTRFDTGTVAV